MSSCTIIQLEPIPVSIAWSDWEYHFSLPSWKGCPGQVWNLNPQIGVQCSNPKATMSQDEKPISDTKHPPLLSFHNYVFPLGEQAVLFLCHLHLNSGKDKCHLNFPVSTYSTSLLEKSSLWPLMFIRQMFVVNTWCSILYLC